MKNSKKFLSYLPLDSIYHVRSFKFKHNITSKKTILFVVLFFTLHPKVFSFFLFSSMRVFGGDAKIKKKIVRNIISD